MEEESESFRIEALKGESRTYLNYLLFIPDTFRDRYISLSDPIGGIPTNPDDETEPPEDLPPFPVLQSAKDYATYQAVLFEQLGITEEQLPELFHRSYSSVIDSRIENSPLVQVTVYRVEIEEEEFFLQKLEYPPSYKQPPGNIAWAIGPDEDI